MTRKQAKAEESAQKKSVQYEAWHVHFYGDHFRVYMLKNLASIAAAINPDDGDHIILRYIDEHCQVGPAITAKAMADELKQRLIQ